ncbi:MULTISPECIES: preprotein translocase subunit SecA [Sanguibacteroides]|uniref:Protein translocase subunit SecA n=1 Tax=Sanguibacteroides justesenii TaxID=1547597 RepID=A0A0C3RD85_9PORP|nr:MULTISPECIES: preprotein translocase subunit SecA [Sanguibacteroides]KIO44156.1 preprotein translocase subunit SecA [Sanguibacteroides justesenii]KIO47186.1 preprotein translocase subunit SecA [Sanguibacteroides justesenii]PXZ43815.1 preprotein translocase subunit SecA [Sanguibacteroides justesenii]
MGFNDILKQLFGNKSDRDLKELLPIVAKVNAEWEKVKKLSDDELRALSADLKAKVHAYVKEEEDEIATLKAKIENEKPSIEEREDIYTKIDKLEEQIDKKIEEVLNEIMPTAFAVMKDTARRFTENKEIVVKANDFDRQLAVTKDFVEIDGDEAIYFNSWIAGGNEVTWDMVHYDVQLIGGAVLHQGKIAEMATGEGKTLVATLPVFLNALTGRGVHVVTVNDYLAKRDSEWMGPLYMFHGLSVDCIDKTEPNSPERRKAYQADITFGTNNEFGFDYLRDNMSIHPEDLVQRKHNYAIVDEVDSVLIDDARTPLIISGPVPKGDDQMFDEYKPRVEKLVKMQRDLVTRIFNEAKVLLASDDKKKVDEGAILLLRAFKGLPKYKPLIKFLSEQGNKAILVRTENIYMQENNRRMPEITDDLYFVIDEKQNSIDLTDKGHDTITAAGEDPDFFILPDIGSELAEIDKMGLSDEDKIAKKDELIQGYAAKSERVHTVNQLLKAYTLFELDVEYVVIDNKVKIVDEQTGRIMEGRRYSDGLHQAIEAKENVKVEAATQTFATITLQNYFRMYHKLAGMTGTAETEAGEFWDIYKLDVVVIPTNRPVVRKDANDYVYKTKREKYNAVIDEITRLVGEGRPVLVGTTSVEVSELLSRMLKLRGIKHNVLNAKLHQREAEIVAVAGQSQVVTIATNMAGRGTDIKLSPEVRAAGGLAIVGTERHDSRRVDRQLRGRAGRQGDPGSSQFFVSLEDDLMRLFSSERIIRVMDRLGHEEGDVIQHSMITKSIERAQRKVEENNFGIRKRLLEYDDVMNSQREVIYKKRRHALLGERIGVDIANTMYDVCEGLVEEYKEANDLEGFRLAVLKNLSVNYEITPEVFQKKSVADITEDLYRQMRETYTRKVESISRQAFPVIKNVFEQRGELFKNIIVPFTDGMKMYNVVTNLEKAYHSGGEELVRAYEKSIMLAHIDDAWKEHLREMDDLKQSVQNATYEQKDPLLIYKFESFNLFKSMVDKINKSVVSTLMKGQIPFEASEDVRQAEERRTDLSKMKTGRSDMAPQANREQRKQEPVHVGPKVGRNDPCPCGSGKKYKNCHGKEE